MHAHGQGDLFGNSGKDNTEGLLYLSRLDPNIDPKKIHLKDSKEIQRSFINLLGLKGAEDVVAKGEVNATHGLCYPRGCHELGHEVAIKETRLGVLTNICKLTG